MEGNMSEELKPCPFCGSDAQTGSAGEAMTLFVTQLRDALTDCITVLCWTAAVLVICVVVG